MEVEIISKTPLTIAEVKETLDALEKKGELSGSQQKIKDFATRFNKLDKASATKLVKELSSADIPRMTEEAAVEIANMLPKNDGELNTVFAGKQITVTKENLKKILDIVKNQ